jgi:FkbM family methyltransferase
MIRFAARALRRLLILIFGQQRTGAFFVRAAAFMGVDLLATAYRRIGILNYETAEASGETYLMGTILPRAILTPRPVLLDVGANVGEMAIALRRSFPGARIIAFEPNPVTYAKLTGQVATMNVECMAMGLGSAEGTGVLYCYRHDPSSGHASLHRDVFEIYEGYGVEGAQQLTSFEFAIRTLDSVCAELGVDTIDFLKLDVEGHELQVLRGAKTILDEKRISLIQFEFTDCNVMSRTFMRDFYELLPDFTFYRLGPDRLIPMGPYAARLEIFQYQNVLAIRNGLPGPWQDFTGPAK